MADVFDVAKYILGKTGQISIWKLQKLCYYAQAWSLAWTEKPIFQEEFEAWSNGPVCKELFQTHKGLFFVSSETLPRGDTAVLTEEEIDTINSVLEGYGQKEPYELRELTHDEDPWKEARGSLPEEAPSSAIISKDAMGYYYGSF